MSCGCENKKRMQDIAGIRELARKAAIITNEVYILIERESGTFDFLPDGSEYMGKLIEYVFP